MDCKERILSNDYMDLITDFLLPPGSIQQEAGSDFCLISVDDTYNLVYLNRAGLPPVTLSVYDYQNTPNLYGLMQNFFDPVSLIKSGITQVQREPLNLTGRGVVVAFIDTGIDYTLDAFRDEQGNTRILSIWDQTIQTGTPPEGYLYGTEYTREQINEALRAQNPYDVVPSRDELQHGTTLAGLAASSRLNGGRTYLGAAPDAELVVVKLKQCKPYLRDYYLIPEDVPAYEETDIMLGVKYAESFARFFERPVIICIGLGTNQGDHNGTSPLASYLSAVAERKSHGVVVCGGNEGNARHHYTSQLVPHNNGGENYKDVEIRVGEGTRGFVIELWGHVPDIYALSVRSPGGEVIPPGRVGLGGGGITYTFIYEQTRVLIDGILVEQNAGDELINIKFENPTPGIWTIRVMAEGEIYNGVFHMWLPITQFLGGETYFLESDPNTTMTEPAYAPAVITVSTYNDANDSFYEESGRGFSRNGSIKPDLAAPGVNVSTLFGRETGSSLAAAITAGAMAQFMQWAVVEKNSQLMDSIQIRNYLIRGAKRSSDRMYPNQEWGYGRLDIAGAFDALARI